MKYLVILPWLAVLGSHFMISFLTQDAPIIKPGNQEPGIEIKSIQVEDSLTKEADIRLKDIILEESNS